ncbi:MAG: YncE family protein [candidate division WOR-3 bacterium]
MNHKLSGKILLLVAGLGLLVMCRRWNNPHDPLNNRPPNQPSRPWPASGDSTLDSSQVIQSGLRWAGGDSDPGDRVYYRLFFGTTTPPVLIESILEDTVYRPQQVRALASYYWRVVAFDSLGDSAVGPLWNFRTARFNRAPNIPSAPEPDSGATDQLVNLTLSWTGGDPDPGDSVTYDIYLGTTTPPPLAAADLKQTSFRPERLNYDTDYYWRVVAKDRRNATTVGPLWSFRTAPPVVVTSPAGGSRWAIGSTHQVLWNGGPAGDSTVIWYSTNGGMTWPHRQGRATQPGRFDWRVPAPATENAKLQVRVFVGRDTALGVSATFAVTDTNPPSPITVDSPPAGARWLVGSTHYVVWRGGTFGVDSTVIFYSSNGGTTWSRQGRAETQGSYLWTVPGPATNNGKIQVKAYCLNKSTEGFSGQFSVVERSYPDSVIATVPVGSRPRALLWDSLTNTVFVANYSSGGGVSVIDGTTNQLVTTIPVGDFPTALCWNATNNRIYVANYTDSSLSVIDAATNQVLTTVAVGPNPYLLCWNQTNNKVYVAHKPGNTVTIVDGVSNSVITTVQVDTNPVAMTWNPAVNKVYVANWANNTVTVIDGANNAVLATVPVDINPCALVVDGQANVLCANQFSNTASIISGTTNQRIATVTVEAKPWAAAYNGTNNRLYTANSDAGSVSVINGQHYYVEDDITVGLQPRSIAWADWVNKLYVGNYDGASVTVIDGANNAVLKTITVGARPIAICTNPRDNKVYVANYDAGTVSIIGGATK